MTLLKGKTAIVTGAGHPMGIGRAIALKLAGQGANVAITDVQSVSGLDDLAWEISDLSGEKCIGIHCDITSKEDIVNTVKQTRKDFSHIDILVNNAGITRDNLLLRMKEEEWVSVIETNLSSLYRMCKGCARAMLRARAGRIVNVSSISAGLGNAGQSNYAAAKAGVEGFTRSLARELAGRNITVNAIAPGFIDTDMTRAMTPERRAELVAQIPLGRMGDAGDVAAAVTFLASPRAAYITGQTLHVNGGLLMR